MIPKNNDMRFEVATTCNYNCTICPINELTRKKEIMDFDLFRRLFDKICSETNQYDTITFPGMGEPLLDKSLDKKIGHVKKNRKNITVLVLTNGSYLTPDRFKEFENLGVASVRVSFYGNDSESYSKVHGVSNEELFYKVRDNLVKISHLKTSTQLLLTYNAVNGHNDHDIKNVIKFWKDKVDLIEIWNPHNWVDGKNFRAVQKEQLNTCGRPFNGPLQIQVDGTVNMCCFDFDGKLTIGDLKSQSLKQIFESTMFQKIVECHTAGDFEGSRLICENCDLRNKDKKDVMIYNSKFNIAERVNMISTTYKKIT